MGILINAKDVNGKDHHEQGELKMTDSEDLVNYLCEMMRGKTEYMFYKSGDSEIGVIQEPHKVRDKKSTFLIKVTEYD